MKMGTDDLKLSSETVRALKEDIQSGLERENRGKVGHAAGGGLAVGKRVGMGGTPRAAAGKGDVFGM